MPNLFALSPVIAISNTISTDLVWLQRDRSTENIGLTIFHCDSDPRPNTAIQSCHTTSLYTDLYSFHRDGDKISD